MNDVSVNYFNWSLLICCFHARSSIKWLTRNISGFTPDNASPHAVPRMSGKTEYTRFRVTQLRVA